MNYELAFEPQKRTGHFHLVSVALVIALSPFPATAQTPDPQPPGSAPDPERPTLNPFPAKQNWGFLANPSKSTDLFDPVAGSNHARHLGNQGDIEIRWAPRSHVMLALNGGGFRPGQFFDNVTYNRGSVVGNVGVTYRF
jgi:hypothetical protein